MDKANPNTSRRQDSPMIDDFLDVNQADSDIVNEDSGTSNFITNSMSLEKISAYFNIFFYQRWRGCHYCHYSYILVSITGFDMLTRKIFYHLKIYWITYISTKQIT